MAMMAGLFGAATGQAQGQHDAYLQALAQQAQQQDFLERQREFDAQQKLAEHQQEQSEKQYNDTRTQAGLNLKLTPKQQMNPVGPKGQAPSFMLLGQHYANLANIAQQQGASDPAATYASLSKEYFTAANQQQSQVQKFMDETEKIRHDKMEEGHWSQQDENNFQRTRDYYTIGIQRNEVTADDAIARVNEQYYSTNQNNATRVQTTGMRDTAQLQAARMRLLGAAQQSADRLADQDMRQMENANAIATREKKPIPYPDLNQFKTDLNTTIAKLAKDPSLLPKALNGLEADQTYSPQLKQIAVRALINAVQTMQQGTQQSGGSDANVPPPSPWP